MVDIVKGTIVYLKSDTAKRRPMTVGSFSQNNADANCYYVGEDGEILSNSIPKVALVAKE